MSRILPVEKRVEHFAAQDAVVQRPVGTHLADFWRGSMWRPVVEGEEGDERGMRRVWLHDGVGGYMHFHTPGEAEVWRAVEVECWLKPIAEKGEYATADVVYEVVLREKNRLFGKLTDNELHALMEMLDTHVVEYDLDIRFETFKRLARAADAENTARAMEAKRLLVEHGIMP